MAVKIGSARSSYGNTAPGDQNGGKEVSTENWYLHSKGWIVLRAIEPVQRELIALAMERACDNNDIGYSQPTRNISALSVAKRCRHRSCIRRQKGEQSAALAKTAAGAIL